MISTARLSNVSAHGPSRGNFAKDNLNVNGTRQVRQSLVRRILEEAQSMVFAKFDSQAGQRNHRDWKADMRAMAKDERRE